MISKEVNLDLVEYDVGFVWCILNDIPPEGQEHLIHIANNDKDEKERVFKETVRQAILKIRKV